MNQIINVTEKAQQYIGQLYENSENAGKSLRLSVIGGGCSGLSYKMDFDQAKDSDHKFSCGSFQLIIDPKSSIYLKGTILDYQDGLQGKGFVFKNPNANNSCGCGESFSV
jgi:iron-sulfur cluster assembly protein